MFYTDLSMNGFLLVRRRTYPPPICQFLGILCTVSNLETIKALATSHLPLSKQNLKIDPKPCVFAGWLEVMLDHNIID